jgi:hypothetical protein
MGVGMTHRNHTQNQIVRFAAFVLFAGTAQAQDVANVPEAPEMFAPAPAPAPAPGPNADRQQIPTAESEAQERIREVDAEEAEEPGPNTGRLHFLIGADFTNAYYYRGLRQEDDGILVQPYAGVTFDAITRDDWALALSLSTWNSFHDQGTGTPNDEFSDKWYESDIVLGASLAFDKWTLGASYSWFVSPSDAWATIQQVDLTVAYDDSEALGAWALSPTATITFETDNAADGQDEGRYLQLGIAPGFEHELANTEAEFSFPVTVGLSLGDYYQNAAGEDETFGYLSVGAKASFDLPMPKDLGEWSAYVSATGLLLGDTTKTFNENDEAELIVAVGLAIEY